MVIFLVSIQILFQVEAKILFPKTVDNFKDIEKEIEIFHKENINFADSAKFKNEPVLSPTKPLNKSAKSKKNGRTENKKPRVITLAKPNDIMRMLAASSADHSKKVPPSNRQTLLESPDQSSRLEKSAFLFLGPKQKINQKMMAHNNNKSIYKSMKIKGGSISGQSQGSKRKNSIMRKGSKGNIALIPKNNI